MLSSREFRSWISTGSTLVQAVAVALGIYFGVAELKRDNAINARQEYAIIQDRTNRTLTMDAAFNDGRVLKQLDYMSDFLKKLNFSDEAARDFIRHTYLVQSALRAITDCIDATLCIPARRSSRFCKILEDYVGIIVQFSADIYFDDTQPTVYFALGQEVAHYCLSN